MPLRVSTANVWAQSVAAARAMAGAQSWGCPVPMAAPLLLGYVLGLAEVEVTASWQPMWHWFLTGAKAELTQPC